MFRFEHPQYLYVLIVIPVLVVLHYYTNYRRRCRLRTFGDPEVLAPLMPDVSVLRREIKTWAMLVALALCVFTLARPQFGLRVDKRKRQGIEAIIALDISNSMLAQDVTPSRLDKAKMLVSSIVDKMTDDKIGLIVYAGEAYTQLPITSDYVSAKMFLETISPALITTQGTDIKQAIELAQRSFTESSQSSKAIFVITDGEDNEGGAVEAARQAAQQGIKVFVLGVGSPQGSPIPQPSGSGYILDNTGNVVVSKLNEQMCNEIASAGNGSYIYVDNSSNAQKQLSEYVDKLAKTEIDSMIFSEYDEQFQAVALLALLALLIDMLLTERRNPRLRRIHLFRRTAICLCLLTVIPLQAQTQKQQRYARSFVRSGNRLYRDSLYDKAETDYRKSISLDSHNPIATYNLGNALMYQNKAKEALETYRQAAITHNNPLRQASVYHNMGVLLQAEKKYAEAIESYKEALRRAPYRDDTRYNLVLCQYLLKNNPQQGEGGSEDENGNQEQQKKDEEKQQQQQKEEQQKQQQQQQDQQKQMSKQNAEQLLNAAMQDEKDTQEKLKKAAANPRKRKLEKQW